MTTSTRTSATPMFPAQALSTALNSPTNNYNAVRLIAAAMVIVSHAYLILNPGGDVQPLWWSSYDLGSTAVNIFFVLSGAMISRSFDHSSNIKRFIFARVIRIYPAFLVAAIVVAFLIAPLGSAASFGDFFAHADSWTYPFRAAVDFADARIDQAFTGNLRDDTNAPLWTIRYEILAYTGFAALAVMGFAKNRLVIAAALVFAGLGVMLCQVTGYDAYFIGHIFRFAFAFLLGVTAYRWSDRIMLSPLLALLLVACALMASDLLIGRVLSITAFGYAGLTLGGMNFLSSRFLRQNDFSYGLYLYGWPIQQAVAHHIGWGEDRVILHILLTLALVAPFAAGSWFLVEKPALKLKKRPPARKP